jgi:glycosyltransferase involved in cell wall biosynthesis
MDAMIAGYAGEGAEVYLMAMNTTRHRVGDDKLRQLYPDIAGFHTVPVDNRLKTLALLRNFLFSSKPEHVDRFSSPAFSTRLHELLRSIDPQVVQLESPFLASYIPLIRKAAPRALITYRMHNIEAQIWHRLAGQATGLKAVYLRSLASRMARFEETLWKTVDLLIPITNTDAVAVEAKGIKTPIQVAPFGITPPETEQHLPQGPFKVYHIGAMDWLPNQEAISWFLKEVWPLAHANAPEITFHFAGRNMPSSFYEGLPAGAFCEGEVPDAQAFACDKHILVVPLYSGGGIRIKILEAMAAGKLVISTEVGMQGIDAQNEIHYLKADTPQSFAHLIGWASTHYEKANSLVFMAQRIIKEHYDAKDIIKRLLARLDSMVKRANNS